MFEARVEPPNTSAKIRAKITFPLVKKLRGALSKSSGWGSSSSRYFVMD
jgi:hypothetical protein